MNPKVIQKMVALENEDRVTASSVFHYTQMETMAHIFGSEGISFRMTKIDKLLDDEEGKTFEGYFGYAIDELLEDKSISRDEAVILRSIHSTPETILEEIDERGKQVLRRSPAINQDIFVACFSLCGNDEYLKENYIKNDSHKGYCLEFVAGELADIRNVDFSKPGKFKLLNVHYGRDNVIFWKDYVKKMKAFCGDLNSEDFLRLGKGVLVQSLSEYKVKSKREEYRREQEVRLVYYRPTGGANNSLIMREDDKAVYIRLPYYVITGLTKSESVTDSENEEVLSKIKSTRMFRM